MRRNLPARIATRTVLADRGDSGICCRRWSLAAHRTAPLTCEADANPDIAATDSSYDETAPSPARSAIWSSLVANNPTDRVIRPLTRGERSAGARLARAKGSSARCSIARWNTNWNSSWKPSTDCGRRNGILPHRFVLSSDRMRRSMRMTVVDVDWVVDPPTTLAVANNVNCTRGCPQGRGCEPGISKGAPVFRYWSEPAVNDLSEAKPRMTNAIDDVRPGWGCGLETVSSHSTQRPRTKSPARKDPTVVTRVPLLVPNLRSAYAFYPRTCHGGCATELRRTGPTFQFPAGPVALILHGARRGRSLRG